MADMFFSRLHDFYNLYKNQLHTRQEEDMVAPLENNSTMESSLASDTLPSYGASIMASLPNDHRQDIAGDTLDHLLNEPLGVLLSTYSDSETMSWSLEAAASDTQRLPPATSINTDMYSIWPCPTVDDLLEANRSDRFV
jgi:hypothetical protein